MDDARYHYAFAYQPVLDARQASVAVELRYRIAAGANDPMQVANAIIGAFIHSGLDDLLRHRRVHVPIGPSLLASPLPALLPAKHVVFELGSDLLDDSASLEACRELKASGYQFAWRNFRPETREGVGEWLALMDIIKLDIRQLHTQNAAATLAALRQWPARRQASHVERQDDFTLARQSGFELFQGYYFAHVSEVAGNRADPDKLAVLDLLDKIALDADDPVLEATFKNSPRLVLHLLRLVNSSSFALQTQIRSLKHAFAILGRRELARWLHILLFALGDGDGDANPLLELALRRARFMEFILGYRTHVMRSLLQDEAYLAGILSLADTLLGWPIEKVAERLRLTHDVKAALTTRAGPLGDLLSLCEKLEAADFDAVEEIATRLQLTEEAVMHSQNIALVWSNFITHPTAVTADVPADTPVTAAD
jgi:EAL and modified HD-GYP domain-containing signal transduction protein